jgi:quercetin dioxygenase-like cupin family protein
MAARALTKTQPFGERFSLERPLDGPHLSFDLSAEADRLRRERPWADHGHNAITLAKYADLRLVLTVLRSGMHMLTHEPEERLAIQVVSGRLRIRTGRQRLELGMGHLMTLDRAQAHEVEALEDATFLLTVARHPSA